MQSTMPPPQKQQPPPPQRHEPYSVEVIRNNLSKFLTLPQEDQRGILGEMILPQVMQSCDNEYQQDASKITGMLIDFTVFQVEDILDLLENPVDLLDRIREAEQLLGSSQN